MPFNSSFFSICSVHVTNIMESVFWNKINRERVCVEFISIFKTIISSKLNSKHLNRLNMHNESISIDQHNHKEYVGF